MPHGRFALTGAMNSGKTKIINELGNRKINIVRESAMQTVAELQSELGGIEAQQDFLKKDFSSGKPSIFHQRNIKLQLAAEANIDLDTITFLDRGLPDYKAFCLLRELPLSKDMEYIFKNRAPYDKVFISETLPTFNQRNSSGRIINQELAKQMTGYCRKVYEELGYELIEIPIFENDGETIMSSSDRANFILNSI